MTDYVIISDLHLDEYEGRLEKYLELAERLAQVCIFHHTNELIIAGDIINRSVTTPKVLSTLTDMLNTLKSNGIRVSYILGQHDYNQKDITSDLTETYLSLLDMSYIGGTHRNVEGLDICFKDFERGNDISCDPCDILISHVTLGRQNIDQTKFRLAVCGDIHEPVTVGKAMSCSPPMQIHPSEPQEGYYVHLHMDNGGYEVKRIQLPTIFVMPKPQRIKEVQKTEIADAFSQVEIPDEISKDLKLDNMPQPVDMDFMLEYLDIENFRCINKMRIDFSDRVINIKGVNGSGKSTILWALYYAFVYKRGIDFTKLEVKFTYKGSSWIISRGVNKIYKNGEEVLIKNKSGFEEKIIELFPFVELLEFFNVYTYKHFFDCDRVRLFEELFNLKGFAYMTTKTKELKKKYEKDISDLAIKIARNEGQLTSFEEQVQDITLDRESIATTLDQLMGWSRKIDTLEGMKSATKTNITRLSDSINVELVDKNILEQEQKNIFRRDVLIKSISRIKTNVIICPNCGEKINGGNLEELEEELASIPEPEYSGSFISKQLALHESREQNIIDLEKYVSDMERIKTRLEELKDRVDYDEISKLQQQLSQYDQNERIKSKVAELKAEHDDLVAENEKLALLISSCEELLSKVDIKNPGSVPVQRIQDLTKLIETDDIKFSILSELKNGNSKLDIQVVYKGIEYDSCSHGEKAILDLHLLRSITRSLGMVGFVILDESLCTLSPANYEIAGEMIQEINSYNILITSHQEGFNKFDREITL